MFRFGAAIAETVKAWWLLWSMQTGWDHQKDCLCMVVRSFNDSYVFLLLLHGQESDSSWGLCKKKGNWLLTDTLHSDIQRSHWQLACCCCHSDVPSRNVSCGDGEWIPFVSEMRGYCLLCCSTAISLIKSKPSSQTHISARRIHATAGTLILPDLSQHTLNTSMHG